MNKITARRRKAERDARTRGATTDQLQDADQGAGDGLEVLGADSPTGLLSAQVADEDDLDPIDAEARQEAARQADADRQSRLDGFGQALTTRRKHAGEQRAQAGIEEGWT